MPGHPTPPPLRVLHVVQKYSSGVGSAIAQYTRSLPEVEHHLLSGTPVDAEGDLAEQAAFTGVHRMRGGHLARIRRVRQVVRALRPDVVHAHSSHGGLYTRMAVSRRSQHVVYTPHCYAFERRDVGVPVRGAFWLAEALLAVNTSAFAACSEREWRLSSWPTSRAPRYLVPNVAPPAATPARPPRENAAPLVIGGGRLSAQKDPATFAGWVAELRRSVPGLSALWLGDGEPARRAALEAAGVDVSGWLPRRKVLEALGTADLYLHSARWEGFPLLVAEAVALGVPTLVRRLPSFADVPDRLTLPADDVGLALTHLDDPATAAANVSAWRHRLRDNTEAVQAATLRALYRREPPARDQ